MLPLLFLSLCLSILNISEYLLSLFLFPCPVFTCCYLLALLFLVSISYLLVLLVTIPVVTLVICYPCCYSININTKLVLLEHIKADYLNIGIFLYKLRLS